jgi:glycogen operon protein
MRRFTRSPTSGDAPERRGTFAGVVDKIPHLNELGVTIVELLPVQQFDLQEGNYWGYMPLNFFAPHRVYAADPGNARASSRR